MGAPTDLTTLATVKAWLNIPSANTDSDGFLSGLITAASRAILGALNRQIYPATITEYRDGTGKPKMMLAEWPVLTIAALTIDGVAQGPSAGPPNGAGYFVVPAPAPPGEMQALLLYGGASFCQGNSNIVITYQAGYAVQGEPATIPATPFQYQAAAPFGPFSNDLGAKFALSGVPLTLVAAAPAAGQYSVTAAGQYTFNAADTGKAVLVSYGYVPAELAQACVETVGEWSKAKERIGIASKGLAGQEQIAYSQKDLNNRVKLMLNPYTKVAPL